MEIRLLKLGMFLSAFLWASGVYGQELSLVANVIVKGQPDVTAIAETSDGGYIVAGNLDHVNGQYAKGSIAKLTATGELDSSFDGPTTDNQIQSILIQPDSRILISGIFRTANDLPGSVFRLQQNGAIDASFVPFMVDQATENLIGMILLPSGKILLSGSFNRNGTKGLLRLNADGTPDLTFVSPTANGKSFSSMVADANYNFMVIGFDGGSPSAFRFNADGDLLPGFPVDLYEYGYPTLVKDGNNAIISSFHFFPSPTDKSFATLMTDGSLTDFNIPFSTSFPLQIAVAPNGKLLVNLINKLYVAEKNGGSTELTASDEFTRPIVTLSGKTFISGGRRLSLPESGDHHYLFRLTADLLYDPTFVTEITRVEGEYAIESAGPESLIVGGEWNIKAANGASEPFFSKLNFDGTVDPTWTPSVFPSTDFLLPFGLAVQNDHKIIMAASKIGRVNADGSLDQSFSVKSFTGANGLTQVKIAGQRIYAVGGTNTVDGKIARSVVRFKMNGEVDQAFESALPENSYVSDFIVLQNKKIVVAGNLPFAGGTNAVVRLNEDGSLDGTFAAGSVNNTFDLKLAIDSQGKIYIGGNFNNYNGIPGKCLIRLLSNGEVDNGFAFAGVISNLTAISAIEVINDQEIFVGTIRGDKPVYILDGNGAVVDRSYDDLGRLSYITDSRYDGATLLLTGRMFKQDYSAVAGVAYVPINKIKGAIGTLAGAGANSNINLFWENPFTNARWIRLERSTGDNQSFVELKTLDSAATAYTDSTCEKGVHYYYRMLAYNSNSKTPFSNLVHTFLKKNQVITFDPPASKPFSDKKLSLTGSSSSGLHLHYISSDSTIASIQDTLLVMHKLGQVLITASQTGDGNFLPALPVERTFLITSGEQFIEFDHANDHKKFGDPSFQIKATSSAGLPIRYELRETTAATIEGDMITIVKPGTFTVKATQDGNAFYSAALAYTTVMVSKGDQVIDFAPFDTLRVDHEVMELVATSSKGLPITFSSSNESVASITDIKFLKFHIAGLTNITASQAGDDYWNAAEVQRPLVVTTVTGVEQPDRNNNIVYPNPGSGLVTLALEVKYQGGAGSIIGIDGSVKHSFDVSLVDGQMPLNLENIPPGFYLLKISNRKASAWIKLIKN